LEENVTGAGLRGHNPAGSEEKGCLFKKGAIQLLYDEGRAFRRRGGRRLILSAGL